jgi:hypothetical protein
MRRSPDVLGRGHYLVQDQGEKWTKSLLVDIANNRSRQYPLVSHEP